MRKFLSAVVCGVAFLGLGFVATGCHSDKPMMGMHMGQKSLYERLGGEPAITAVVDDFVGRAASDPAVNFTRKGTPAEWDASPANVAKLKKHLVQFISMATGGPKMYEGRSMKEAHANMRITEAEFGAIAGDLGATLDKFNVPAKEKNELIAIVASTKGDIVEKK